jgi:mannose PTS system EIIA component
VGISSGLRSELRHQRLESGAPNAEPGREREHEPSTENEEARTAMIGVVVVTHGQLATELLNAAEMIVGDLPRFTAVSIGWHEDTQDARDEIAAAINRVQQGQGVLILTDMFGGTSSNLALTFLGQQDVEVLTGVNLPMLIKVAGLREQDNLLSVAREMREHGRNAIWVASDLLRGEKT